MGYSRFKQKIPYRDSPSSCNPVSSAICPRQVCDPAE
jgi:hypothetical protein